MFFVLTIANPSLFSVSSQRLSFPYHLVVVSSPTLVKHKEYVPNERRMIVESCTIAWCTEAITQTIFQAVNSNISKQREPNRQILRFPLSMKNKKKRTRKTPSVRVYVQMHNSIHRRRRKLFRNLPSLFHPLFVHASWPYSCYDGYQSIDFFVSNQNTEDPWPAEKLQISKPSAFEIQLEEPRNVLFTLSQ
ncbi:hypothetical protein BDV37DRAFT_202754 [Aspergillus pseudonomiae]|uniref:Uncharacterized protein n=1 Tax=Aspergillus pseudonomiae TaxID=1506151 RepID=A0A5N7D249_9EURO|nr:uncharacterized protein BDV37DRAFT_202754 [Aspergillus pseudonomiae]KAE8400492.1 hypothetical protein BDV37DRAFT_202754 [Aspergillus pseudonomiae]